MTSTTNNQNLPLLTVSQLTQAIKLSLESTFPTVWLQGEVSNCKLQTSGHLYLSLKDAQAQIAGIMFRGDMTSLPRVPKDGDQLIVRGEMNVYPQSGKYQLIIREIRYAGIGELLLKLEELKIKLHKKGWFKAEHKKPLPKLPKRIGIITSPTGAVIQDVVNVLSRRFSGFHLILNPVRVQGEGAAKEIAQAIVHFNQYDLVDVMIVGRGGGSIEDLWAFNEEIVAEAIFNSRIPIISAVGHETDHCIADYVADVRAPTPSAAAEIVIAEKSQYLRHFTQMQQRMQQTVLHGIKQCRNHLLGIIKQPILVSPYGILAQWIQKIDDFREDFDQTLQQKLNKHQILLDSRRRQLFALKPTTKIIHFRQKLTQWDKSIQHAMMMRLANARKNFTQITKEVQLNQTWQRFFLLRQERFRQLAEALHAVNPKNVLTKGYCILFSEKENSVITSISAVAKNDDIRILLSDGDILSTVKDIVAK